MKIDDEEGKKLARRYQSTLRDCVERLERVFPEHAVVLVVTPFRAEDGGRTQLHYVGNVNRNTIHGLLAKVIKGIRASIAGNKKLN